MKSSLRVVFALVMTCFFVSGVAGLVYQIAWTRYLSLFLGHTSYAVVAVLAAFMGGLAIGNAVAGVWADRARKPLALYGWIEILIAIYAVFFPSYYELCHSLYISAARQLAASGAGLLLLKFGFSLATVLLPAALMGATFPVLTRFVTRSLSELRERVALLYFMNSLGAVAGCFVADFWWIPKMGLELTVFAAAALNLVAGLVALGVSKGTLEGFDAAMVRPAPNADATDEYFSALDLKLATIAIGISGFVAMLYEVAWTRLLALALGSSTHAYSIMLMTFIAGIAAGAIIIARWKTLRRTLDAFGWAEIALAATTLVSMFAYERLPFWFQNIMMSLARRPEVYPAYQLAQGLICFAVMFVPALCLGMTLPLASRIATTALAHTGRTVGKIFAVNTIGTVLGAVVTGMILMPALGLAATFATGIVLNAAIGAAIIYRSRLVRIQPAMIGSAVALAALLVWGAYGFFEKAWRISFVQGIWRSRYALSSMNEFRSFANQYKIDYYKDGAGSTVAVHRDVNNPGKISLRVNGKADAGSGDVITQLLAGHLPCLLHTKATNALVVGLGSGTTSGAILRHTNILSVQTVEISPEVYQAAHLFTNMNDNALSNPRLKIAIEDAKSFLKATDQKYDIIVSEPSNPWMAGVAGVFTLEYYESCAARLAEGGVMLQWVQIYETNDRTLRTVIKTMTAVFPHVSVWRAQAGDLLLIGTLKPPSFDIEALRRRMKDPYVAQDLARGRFSDPLPLLARELISPQNTPFISHPSDEVHSDYYPLLDYMAPVGLFVGHTTQLHEVYDETTSPRAQTLLGQWLAKEPLQPADLYAAAQAVVDLQFDDADLIYSLVERWAATATNSTLPLEMIERILPTRPAALTEELRLLPKHAWLIEQGKKDIAALHFYERALMRAYRAKRSVLYLPPTAPLQETLGVLLERDPKNQRVFNLHLSELAWDRGDDLLALRYGLAGINPDTNAYGPYVFTLDELAPRQVLANLIQTALRNGNLHQAKSFVDITRARRLLEPGEFFFHPLDLACRKVDAAIENASQTPPK